MNALPKEFPSTSQCSAESSVEFNWETLRDIDVNLGVGTLTDGTEVQLRRNQMVEPLGTVLMHYTQA